MIREQLGDGRRLGVTIDYVDEGEALMGTAGALRLAYDKGVLPATFFVLYGDSYLSVELEAVARDFAARSALALMTVLRNENRWGRSNVIVGDGMVQVYEPDAAVPHPGMRWIDYGVSVLRREIVAARVDRERPAALSALWQQLSRAAELVAFEVVDRFFEIGSPAGLAELEAHLTG